MGIVLDKSKPLLLRSYGQKNLLKFFTKTKNGRVMAQKKLSKTIPIPYGPLQVQKCKYLRWPLLLILCSTKETSPANVKYNFKAIIKWIKLLIIEFWNKETYLQELKNKTKLPRQSLKRFTFRVKLSDSIFFL